MSLLVHLWNNPSLVLIALATLLTGYIAIKVASFYQERKKYPPGPFPLPLLGNLLELRKAEHAKDHFFDVVVNLSKKFGPTFTFHFGTLPIIVVNDPEDVKEVCANIAFAGRMNFDHLMDQFFEMSGRRGTVDGIFVSDYSRGWEVLRKVAHSAVRKFTVSAHFPPKVADSTKEIVQEMFKREGINKSFNPNEYFHLMTHSVLVKAAFGIDFKLDDPDLLMLKKAVEIGSQGTNLFFAIAMVPWLRYWYSSQWKQLVAESNKIIRYQDVQMAKHEETFTPNEIKDFCDALLAAKYEAENENSNHAQFLSNENLVNALTDVFFAGTDTTRMALLWIFLVLANEPDLQEKVRDEIEAQIGEEVPTLENRANCHFINSFVAEVLRFRPLAGSVFHKAIEDTNLSGHKISRGSLIFASLLTVNLDEKSFPEANKFKPDRFLAPDGTFHQSSLKASLPFGCQGRRTCPGNKFAISNIFMFLVGWFQNTKGYKFILEDGPGSSDYSVNIDDQSGYLPKPYKIKFIKAD